MTKQHYEISVFAEKASKNRYPPPGKGGDNMKRPLHWNTPSEVRKSLAKVANEIRNEELTPAQGNALICAGNAILNALRLDVQEKRVAELEKKIQSLEDEK